MLLFSPLFAIREGGKEAGSGWDRRKQKEGGDEEKEVEFIVFSNSTEAFN